MGDSVPHRFLCPWLRSEVELTAERELHIRERHPDLLPTHRARITEVLADPDIVRRSHRSPAAHLFSRWYSDIRQGRHIVVVVQGGPGASRRHWIITAYTTRRLASGELEWHRG
jgi:hypothetical protein